MNAEYIEKVKGMFRELNPAEIAAELRRIVSEYRGDDDAEAIFGLVNMIRAADLLDPENRIAIRITLPKKTGDGGSGWIDLINGVTAKTNVSIEGLASAALTHKLREFSVTGEFSLPTIEE